MLGGNSTSRADEGVVSVEQAVARQILLGLRESLTIAGQLGRPVEEVNNTLTSLRDACDGCLALTRPYPGEPRVVVTIVDWQGLRRIARTR
jgi:hypothetical protein